MKNSVEFDQYVIDQVVARRGRLHAFQHLDPPRTALLVVDMQNAFVAEGGAAELPSARDIVPNINRLALALREHGGHVIWLISTYGPSSENDWPVLFEEILGPERARRFRGGLIEGTPGHALYPALAREPNDPVLSKNRFSGFCGSQGRLTQLLRDHGIDTVIVVGTVTSVCCESTAREATMENFRCIMVADANAGRTREEDMATFSMFIQVFGDVMTADEVISLIRGTGELTG
ncbi:MAG: cysteine hydrolase [Gammaproteobacteria bacterium]|nr:cysteine hydrolase [Gammaproteobacteria bacterium]